MFPKNGNFKAWRNELERSLRICKSSSNPIWYFKILTFQKKKKNKNCSCNNQSIKLTTPTNLEQFGETSCRSIILHSLLRGTFGGHRQGFLCTLRDTPIPIRFWTGPLRSPSTVFGTARTSNFCPTFNSFAIVT